MFDLDVVVEHHFDESRLLRSNLLKRSEMEGRSSAYLAYHWVHDTITFAHLRLAKHVLQLALWRIVGWWECLAREGIAEWEMLLIKEAGFYKQYLIEYKRPRNYEQYGLVKIL